MEHTLEAIHRPHQGGLNKHDFNIPLVCAVQTEIVQRLSGGAQSGRAAAAEKALEKMKEEGMVEKPFVARKRSFA